MHNTSNSTLDLGGMYLSDDLSDSTKWQIPAGTLVPAGGYLLFWADDETAEGPLHAAFRLGAGGEDAALFDTSAAGNGLLDGFSYGPQTSDVAFGRLADGGTHTYLLSTPTPEASNSPAPGASHVYEHSDSSANPVDLVAQGPAVIGGTLVFDVTNAPASQAGSLVIGITPADVASSFGFQLVAPPVSSIDFITDASGTANPSVAIASSPGLVGVQIYSQAFVAGGGGLSNGVVTTIGP